MVRSPFAVFGAVALSLAPAAFAAQNLITNGEFNVDHAGWVPFNATLEPAPDDHGRCDVSSNSGAGSHVAAAGAQAQFYFCVPSVTANQNYSLDGHLLFPSGQIPTGSAYLYVTWQSDPSCNGFGVGFASGSSQSSSTTDVWTHHEMLNLVSPPDAHSAYIGVLLEKNTGAGPLNIRLDGFHMVPRHGMLFFDGFEVISTCRWSDELP